MNCKWLARVVAVLVIAVGVVGLIAPRLLVTIVAPTVTPTGLYVAAAIRLGIGAILFGAANASRSPALLRVFGTLAVLAGLITLFLGTDRARAALDGWSGQGTALVRLTGVAALAFGALLTFLLAPPGRAA